MISQTILVNFDLARQSLSIKSGTHERFGEFVGSPAFELYQDVLLDDIRHLLLLLFPLVDLFLEICNMFRNLVETVAIERTIGDGADESRVRILKGLDMG